jgi:hypothetical protein
LFQGQFLVIRENSLLLRLHYSERKMAASSSEKDISNPEHTYPASVSNGQLSSEPNQPTGEAEAIPSQHKSAFVAFLKQLATFTGDLSSLTCPAFLLSGCSLLEYSSHWGDHPDLLEEIGKNDDQLG